MYEDHLNPVEKGSAGITTTLFLVLALNLMLIIVSLFQVGKLATEVEEIMNTVNETKTLTEGLGNKSTHVVLEVTNASGTIEIVSLEQALGSIQRESNANSLAIMSEVARLTCLVRGGRFLPAMSQGDKLVPPSCQLPEQNSGE